MSTSPQKIKQGGKENPPGDCKVQRNSTVCWCMFVCVFVCLCVGQCTVRSVQKSFRATLRHKDTRGKSVGRVGSLNLAHSYSARKSELNFLFQRVGERKRERKKERESVGKGKFSDTRTHRSRKMSAGENGGEKHRMEK